MKLAKDDLERKRKKHEICFFMALLWQTRTVKGFFLFFNGCFSCAIAPSRHLGIRWGWPEYFLHKYVHLNSFKQFI